LILDDIKLDSSKTKEAQKVFSNLKLIGKRARKSASVLLLLHKSDNNLKLALRNLSFLSIGMAKDTHAYEVITHKRIVVTKDGLTDIVKRFK
jgi:ribosomal protein L4